MKYIVAYNRRTHEIDYSYKADYNTNKMPIEELVDLCRTWEQEDDDETKYRVIDDFRIWDYANVEITKQTMDELYKAVEDELAFKEGCDKYEWLEYNEDAKRTPNFMWTDSYESISHYLMVEEPVPEVDDTTYDEFFNWTLRDVLRKVETELEHRYAIAEQDRHERLMKEQLAEHEGEFYIE